MMARGLKDWLAKEGFAIARFLGLLVALYVGMDKAITKIELKNQELEKRQIETQCTIASLESRMNEVRDKAMSRNSETREMMIEMQGDIKLLLSRVDDLRGAKRIVVNQ